MFLITPTDGITFSLVHRLPLEHVAVCVADRCLCLAVGWSSRSESGRRERGKSGSGRKENDWRERDKRPQVRKHLAWSAGP